MKQFKFKPYVYEKPYTPHYDSYKEHVFTIDHYSLEDEMMQHVWLKCISAPTVIVNGYVHVHDLEEV